MLMWDLQARMLDGTPFVENATTLTNRTMRFRARSWNYTWGIGKPSSAAHLKWLKRALPEQCITNNSTHAVYRDPIKAELDELEVFPKQTLAKQEAVLAQRESVRELLLGPQTAIASSSAGTMALNASALDPMQAKGDANPRKRQRRDSIQSSTSEEFNESIAKRRRLQTASTAIRGDEQVSSNRIRSAHKRQRRNDDHMRQYNHRSQESARIDSPQGLISSADRDHPKYDVVDAPSNSWEARNTAFDQPQEQTNLEAGQLEAGGDDIEYMNDVHNAPAGFWEAVDPAAHQSRVEHDSLSDDQREILKTLACVQLEVGMSYMVISLNDKDVRQGLIDANSPAEWEQLSIETAIHEVADLAMEAYQNTTPQEAKDKRPEINAEQQTRPAYLPVDKTHIVLCIGE